MRKIFYTGLLLLSMFQFANAQEEGKFRVGLDLGYTIPDGGGGILGAIEPKYNIADNMNVGIRFESAAMARNVGELEAEVSSNSSFYGTFDYYFSSGSSFVPFVGAGAGYSSLADISFSSDSILDGFDFGDFDVDTSDIDISTDGGVSSDGKFGGLIRGGFEAGKFRMTVSYNLIGKTKIDPIEVKNSYLGIAVGFYLGGGKW